MSITVRFSSSCLGTTILSMHGGQTPSFFSTFLSSFSILLFIIFPYILEKEFVILRPL